MENIVPIKIYEYLASGKPILSTALPGVEKEFGNKSGLIYTKSIEHMLDIVLNHQNLLLEQTKYAKAFSDTLNWEEKIEKFLNIRT
jgi:glycosyltransferase involved in cell wall biosynthesis